MRRRRRLKRPYDWQIDWPEFALPRPGHVHVQPEGSGDEPTQQARGANAPGTEQSNDTDSKEGSSNA